MARSAAGQQRRRVPGRALAIHEPLELRRLGPRAAEHVDQDRDHGAADRQAEADPERDARARRGRRRRR